jgi:DNA-binding transcriptional ArsR family regulator
MRELCIIAKALSSITRLRLIEIISEFEKLTATEVYNIYREKYNDSKHRESIYRELEKLVTAKILKKEYDDRTKRIVYKLHLSNIKINLQDLKIETGD